VTVPPIRVLNQLSHTVDPLGARRHPRSDRKPDQGAVPQRIAVGLHLSDVGFVKRPLCARLIFVNERLRRNGAAMYPYLLGELVGMTGFEPATP
jgi:hypothetical protein